MKRLLSAIFFSIILSSCASNHPALRIYRLHFKIAENNHIVPYTLNLIALRELEDHLPLIEKYLLWFLNNLNYPDVHGLTGSIYDFMITKKGVESTTRIYDSVDSYSATFLILLNEYTKQTGDNSILREYEDRIADVAYTIFSLQQEDGLTIAVPHKNIKYLMDNCEVYGGLAAMIELCDRMEWNLRDFYQLVLDKLKTGIQNELFDEQRSNFYWARDEVGPHISDWDNYYPDAYAQLFPILYDLLEEEPDLKKLLWSNFNDRYKNKINISPEQQIVIDLVRERMGG
jgi:hypothetical protein